MLRLLVISLIFFISTISYTMQKNAHDETTLQTSDQNLDTQLEKAKAYKDLLTKYNQTKDPAIRGQMDELMPKEPPRASRVIKPKTSTYFLELEQEAEEIEQEHKNPNKKQKRIRVSTPTKPVEHKVTSRSNGFLKILLVSSLACGIAYAIYTYNSKKEDKKN